MRAVLLALAVLLFAACDMRSHEEKALDRAQRDLDKAREELAEAREDLDHDLAEARERVHEARDRLREIGGDVDEDLREDLKRVYEDVARAHRDVEESMEDTDFTRDLGRALEDIGQALQEDSDVEPVDFRRLRRLLPDEIDGMEREDVEGETAGFMGIRVSHVQARYDGVGRDVEVTIVDLGTLKGVAAAGLDWLDGHIDRESDDGYERTTEIDGNPAHVRVRHWNARSEIEATVLIDGRFVVHIAADGRDLSESLIEDVLDQVGDLGDWG